MVARAGSGKTRVIVAKITYLVAVKHFHLSEIIAFMFNRTAAAEVNQRISAVLVDGKSLLEIDGCVASTVTVASTFHKFALDVVKSAGERPDILTDTRHAEIIQQCFSSVFLSHPARISPRDRAECLKLTSSFIARAGQKYPGELGLKTLATDLRHYLDLHLDDPAYQKPCQIHQIAFRTYRRYVEVLTNGTTDFNFLMHRATTLISQSATSPAHRGPIFTQFSRLKYILIDEYQDFSFLFFALIQSLRAVCPATQLFAVGDDWQAINRFAGSDVAYFINFDQYFPEDSCIVPLMTNYRSARAIVENANNYMLKNYDHKASRAVAFSRETGKVHRLKLSKVSFDLRDYEEDALGDGRFQVALLEVLGSRANLPDVTKSTFLPSLQLLKATYKIIKKHRKADIMLLHRQNFLSSGDILLEDFYQALKLLLTRDAILCASDFDRQVRCLTIHKSKGLEAEVVILLEFNRDLILSEHPHAQLFTIFGDNAKNERSDQHRLIYVGLTRAKKHLYLLTADTDFAA